MQAPGTPALAFFKDEIEKKTLRFGYDGRIWLLGGSYSNGYKYAPLRLIDRELPEHAALFEPWPR